MNTPLKSPQVAAVQQTLAGERLTMAVQFPTTGDADCDFIQGILAVGKALDVAPSLAVRVLGYMLERWKHEQDNLKSPTGKLDWSIMAAIHQAVANALANQRIATTVGQTSPPWYATSGTTVAVTKNPDGTETSELYQDYLTKVMKR